MEVQLWCDGEQGPRTKASALVEHVSPAVVILGEEEPELELEQEPQPLLIPERVTGFGGRRNDLIRNSSIV